MSPKGDFAGADANPATAYELGRHDERVALGVDADAAGYIEATSFGVLRALELFIRDLRDLQKAELHEAIVHAEAALVHFRECRTHLPMQSLEELRRVYSSPTLRYLGKVSELTGGMAGSADDGLGGMQNGGTP